MSSFLGIDLGTGSMKGALFTKGELSMHSGEYKAGTRLEGFAQDVALFTESFRSFCQQILESRSSQDQLKSLAISCHGPSLVTLDHHGRPIGTMKTWQDNSATEESLKIRNLYAGFSKDGSSWEAKCLKEFNSGDRNGKTFLYPKDYINYLLTGHIRFDRSTASTLCFYDKSKAEWVAEEAGIPNESFPPVIAPYEEVGLTSTAFSRSCGLPDGIPVLAGGIDAYCEAVGAGAVLDGDVTDGSGTSTCLSVCLPHQESDFHVMPNKGLQMAVLSNTGSAIQWYSGISGKDYRSTRILPSIVPTLFLPFLNGERSPYWDEKLQGAFVGLTGQTGDMDLYQAVLQGISFAIGMNLERMPEIARNSDRPIFAAGGGAENDHWLQTKANILNRPYSQPYNKDTAPLGDLWLCGHHAGMSQPLEEMGIKTSKKVFYPQVSESEKALLQDLYKEYQSTVEFLTGTFHRLSDYQACLESTKN
jgi:xylulokinase